MAPDDLAAAIAAAPTVAMRQYVEGARYFTAELLALAQAFSPASVAPRQGKDLTRHVRGRLHLTPDELSRAIEACPRAAIDFHTDGSLHLTPNQVINAVSAEPLYALECHYCRELNLTPDQLAAAMARLT